MYLGRNDKNSIRTHRLEFWHGIAAGRLTRVRMVQLLFSCHQCVPFRCFRGVRIFLERVNHLAVENLYVDFITIIYAVCFLPSRIRNSLIEIRVKNTLHSCNIFAQNDDECALGELHMVNVLHQQSNVCLFTH